MVQFGEYQTPAGHDGVIPSRLKRQLGRPRKMSEETVERIRELERLGMSASDIAHELNAEGVPTATGRGRWHPPGVARALSWVRS